jgi:hypothetical protein
MNRLGLRTLTTSSAAPKTKFARPNRLPVPVASLSTTTPRHVPSALREPTPPQLPPRRRPQFAAAGFGLGGSHTVGGGKLGVPVAAVPEVVEGKEDHVDGLEGDVKASNEAEACYVVGPLSLCPNLALTFASQPPPTTLHYHHPCPLPLTYSPHPLPQFSIAYETWGTLNPDRSNAILLHTGLSASSHVASGGNGVAEETGGKKGWWEDFVGPGKSVDTDKFFVICTNVVGGCL